MRRTLSKIFIPNTLYISEAMIPKIYEFFLGKFVEMLWCLHCILRKLSKLNSHVFLKLFHLPDRETTLTIPTLPSCIY